MSTFFPGWRRKLGCVTLVVACLLMAGWARSLTVRDVVDFSQMIRIPMNRGLLSGIVNDQGRIAFMRTDLRPVQHRRLRHPGMPGQLTPDPPPPVDDGVADLSETAFTTVTAMLVDRTPIFSVPYWSLVIPLTLLSAWLLLRRPRQGLPSIERPVCKVASDLQDVSQLR